jgi:hypothetical protein
VRRTTAPAAVTDISAAIGRSLLTGWAASIVNRRSVSAARNAVMRAAAKPPTGSARIANRVAVKPSTAPMSAKPALAASSASAGLSARKSVIDTAVMPISR